MQRRNSKLYYLLLNVFNLFVIHYMHISQLLLISFIRHSENNWKGTSNILIYFKREKLKEVHERK
jgi:hypothetical protein